MKSKENIVFLGMMGSGKSSIGSLLSRQLKVDFYDIDNLIELEMGMKISKIFDLKGEAFFRDIEEKMTLKILKKSNVVISLGGGAFLNKKIRKEVLENHKSFWLKLDAKTIIDRIKDSHKRPLAANLTKSDLISLIKKRSDIYSKALYKIECSNLKKKDILNKVLKIYETNKIDN